MVSAAIGIVLFVMAGILALVLGWIAQKHVHRSLHQSLDDHSDYVRFMQDKHDLNRLGFAQQLTRRMNGFSAFAVPFSGMSVLTGAALLLLPALSYSGPWLLGFGWPLLGMFAMLVACAHGAQISGQPTAGGGYHSAAAYGGRRAGIAAGWLQFIGSALLLTATNVWVAQWLSQTLASWRALPAQPWMFYGCMLLLYGSQYGYSIRASRQLSRHFVWTAWMQVLAVVGLVVVISSLKWSGYLPVSTLFQWQHPFDLSGRSPSFTSGLIGFLLLNRSFMGAEHAAPLAEETVDPRIQVPWAVFLSPVYILIFGYVLFVFLFLHYPLAPSTGSTWQIVIDELADIGRGWGGILPPLLFIIVLWAGWSSGLSAMTAASRTWFAMSRDEAVPGAKHGAAVSFRWRVPHYAILLTALLSLLAGLFMLFITKSGANRHEVLIQMLTLSLIGLNSASIVAIGAKRLAGLRRKAITAGPWQLGRLGTIVDYAALLWLSLTLAGAAWLLSWPAWAAACASAGWIWFAAEWKARYLSRKAYVKSSGSSHFSRRGLNELIRIERKFPQH